MPLILHGRKMLRRALAKGKQSFPKTELFCSLAFAVAALRQGSASLCWEKQDSPWSIKLPWHRDVPLTKLIKMAENSKSLSSCLFIDFCSQSFSSRGCGDLPANCVDRMALGLSLIWGWCYYFFIIVYCIKSTSFSPEEDCSELLMRAFQLSCGPAVVLTTYSCQG